MSLSNKSALLVLFVCLTGFAASCAQKGQKFSVQLQHDRKEASTAVPTIGIPAVAPTPRNFPRHTPADVESMFEQTAQASKSTVLIYQWSDPNLLTVADQMLALSEKHRLMPILALSPTTLDQQRKELDVPKALRRGKVSFGSPDLKSGFIKTVQDLARRKPPYLCLATEINLLALQRMDEYLKFAELYKEAYRAAKEISPMTKVFVSFQYEFIRVVDNKAPGKIEEHGKIIDILRPELDLIAITTYPAEFYESPADMPGNYYTHLLSYLKPGEQVMVMEVGWPSSGAGSEEEQRQFVDRLPALLADLNPLVTAWALLHDVKLGAFGTNLATTGLLTPAGQPKPALASWKGIATLPPRAR